MDQFQQMMQTIREQLSKLSATQRMLIASLTVLLLMPLSLVSQHARDKRYVDLDPAGAGGDGSVIGEMAAELVISEATVRTHVSNILGKLHVASRTQAALFALKEGLASLDDVEELS